MRYQIKSQPFVSIGLAGNNLIPTKLDWFWACSKKQKKIGLSSEVISGEINAYVPQWVCHSHRWPEFKWCACKWSIKALSRTLLLYRGSRWKSNPTWCNQVSVSTSCYLHYARAFLQLGAIEIWIQSWTCHRKHFIPLHELLRSLGKRKSRVILKTRVLSVCDVTRKIKLALKFLLWSLNQKNTWSTSKKKEGCFGDVFWLVEKYLIQLCRSGAKLGTFSDLRDNSMVIVTSHWESFYRHRVL